MSTFPEPQPHGPLEELFPDVFLVRGSIRLGPLVAVRRNMVVLREGSALTLVNAVRLSASGEAALEQLGAVRHLVKLGHFHTLDDPYFRSRFSPKYWAPQPTESGVERLVDGGPSPLGRASVFSFSKATKGEAALVVEQPAGNLLVTCDSVQHWGDTSGCSLVGGLVSRAMGFLKARATIGPIWLKEVTGGNPAALRPDFDRLLALDFAHLISGHGGLLRDDARSALAQSCEQKLHPR